MLWRKEREDGEFMVTGALPSLPPKGCGYRLLGILGNCFCYYLQCVLDAASGAL